MAELVQVRATDRVGEDLPEQRKNLGVLALILRKWDFLAGGGIDYLKELFVMLLQFLVLLDGGLLLGLLF